MRFSQSLQTCLLAVLLGLPPAHKRPQSIFSLPSHALVCLKLPCLPHQAAKQPQAAGIHVEEAAPAGGVPFDMDIARSTSDAMDTS